MDQASYYWKHPPRWVAVGSAQPTEIPRSQFDRQPSASQMNVNVLGVDVPEHINTVFLLTCRKTTG